MPNSSAKRSAAPWLRDPTETATPESVSRRSVTNVLAIPPVPRIPHRTGLFATSSSLRRSVTVISLFEGRSPRPGEHLPLHDWPAQSALTTRPRPVAWPRCSPRPPHPFRDMAPTSRRNGELLIRGGAISLAGPQESARPAFRCWGATSGRPWRTVPSALGRRRPAAGLAATRRRAPWLPPGRPPGRRAPILLDPPVAVATLRSGIFIVLSPATDGDQSAAATEGSRCQEAAAARASSVRRMSRNVTGTAASPVSPVTQNAHWNPPVSAAAAPWP